MTTRLKELGQPVAHWRLCLFGLLAWCLCSALPSRSAFAQFDHSDAVLRYEGGKVVMDAAVYSAVFPTTGISKQFTTNPGFASETDVNAGIGPNEQVVYNVLDGLYLWDGTTFVDPLPGTFIRIQNNPPNVPATIVSRDSGLQEGSIEPPTNRIGSSSGSGNVHAHVNFTLDTEDGSEPLPGAYGIKLSVMTSNEAIAASDPIFFAYNFGLDLLVFREGLAAYEALLSATGLPGDFDQNGVLDAADIDLLTTAVLSGSSEPIFDVNADGTVNGQDRTYWVESLKQTYFGDSNLDGTFTSGDLVAVFQRGEYEDQVVGNSTWEDGDWDGDLEFGSGDFVTAFQAGGYEAGPRGAVAAAVPEPAGSVTALLALSLLTPLRRRR